MIDKYKDVDWFKQTFYTQGESLPKIANDIQKLIEKRDTVKTTRGKRTKVNKQILEELIIELNPIKVQFHHNYRKTFGLKGDGKSVSSQDVPSITRNDTGHGPTRVSGAVSACSVPLYPDESLNESEIKTIMRRKNAVFCPVIARDEIDDIKVNSGRNATIGDKYFCSKPTFFVMNLSNRDETGTHWVACYIDKYSIRSIY